MQSGTKASTVKPTKTKEISVEDAMPTTEEALRQALRTKIQSITKELDQSIDQLKKQKKINAKELHEQIRRRRSFSQTLRDLTNMLYTKLQDLYKELFAKQEHAPEQK